MAVGLHAASDIIATSALAELVREEPGRVRAAMPAVPDASPRVVRAGPGASAGPVRAGPGADGQEVGNASGGASDRELVELKQVMWDKVGLVRDEEGLRDAVGLIAAIRAGAGPRLLASVDVALLVARAALGRRESRGAHFRSDYPDPDPAMEKRSYVGPDELRSWLP
ncbi:MAG: hypothetical protein ACYDH5_09775 [Acidimicrobiales bacterium]